MKSVNTLLLFSIAMLAFSCEYNSQLFDPTNGQLPGSWQLVERGYSPGAGYIVDPVPLSPVQRLSFNIDGTFTSNITGLTDFRHYQMIEDTATQSTIVALFRSKPKSVDIANLEHSYHATFADGKLRLAFRYCIEGCHMLLRPLESN